MVVFLFIIRNSSSGVSRDDVVLSITSKNDDKWRKERSN